MTGCSGEEVASFIYLSGLSLSPYRSICFGLQFISVRYISRAQNLGNAESVFSSYFYLFIILGIFVSYFFIVDFKIAHHTSDSVLLLITKTKGSFTRQK